MDLKELSKYDWKAIFGVWVWRKMLKDWNRHVVLDKANVTSISKAMTLYEKITSKQITPETMKEVQQDLAKFFEWLIIDMNKTARASDRYIITYFQNDGDEVASGEFVKAYNKYVQERYNMDIMLDRNAKDVIKAAIVTKRIAEKYKLSMYQVIKYQHEFWLEGIKTPFTAKALGREDKVEERLQRYFATRKGEVVDSNKKEDNNIDTIPGVVFVKKRWREVLQLGPSKFLTLARGGFLADICKEFVSESASISDKNELIQKYNEDYIAKIWVERGRPMIVM